MLPAPIACPDAATDTSPLLRNRLAGLRERCIGLADSMERSAERLEATGVPPAEALLHDLSQFRRQVAELLSLIPSGDFQPRDCRASPRRRAGGSLHGVPRPLPPAEGRRTRCSGACRGAGAGPGAASENPFRKRFEDSHAGTGGEPPSLVRTRLSRDGVRPP